MKSKKDKLTVGIVGCGAIGSRIAKGIQEDFKQDCSISGLYDIEENKADQLAKNISIRNIAKKSITELIRNCDCMIEAVSAKNTHDIIRQALKAKKDVLSMSVGKLLNASDLFRLASQNKCHLLIPSGAIAGIDAIKAASLVGIDSITLTTRKPPTSFLNNPYLIKKGIDPLKITKETVIFKGDVEMAVKMFPQNINVAATISLASQARKNFKIRILTSPSYKTNSHEIDLKGKFGHIRTLTENVVCPDNPKTSYLAVLSGLQTLKQYCNGVFIGT